MNCKKIYAVCEHIRYEVTGDLDTKIFIIPNTTGIPDMRRVLCLSGTTLSIWDLLKQGKCCDEIIDEMCKIYAKEKSSIKDDITDFINSLKTQQYIVENEVQNV